MSLTPVTQNFASVTLRVFRDRVIFSGSTSLRFASSKCFRVRDAKTQKRLHLPTSVKYLATKFQKQEKNQIVSDPQLDFLRIHLSLQNSIRNETNVPDLDQGVIIRAAINWELNQKTLPNFLRVGWMIVLSPEPVNALGDFAKSIN